MDELWATDMALEVALSGSTTCIALEQSLSLVTVLTMAGVYTTVNITRTYPLRAIAAWLQTVSYNSHTSQLSIICINTATE